MKILLFSLFIPMLLSVQFAFAAECSGNACDDIVFEFVNNCYQARNMGTRRVRVVMGPYSFVLQRGQTMKIGINNCVQSYFGSNTANYDQSGTAVPAQPGPSTTRRQPPPPLAVDEDPLEDQIMYALQWGDRENCDEISRAIRSQPRYRFDDHQLIETTISFGSFCAYKLLRDRHRRVEGSPLDETYFEDPLGVLLAGKLNRGDEIIGLDTLFANDNIVNWIDEFQRDGVSLDTMLLGASGFCRKREVALVAEALIKRGANPDWNGSTSNARAKITNLCPQVLSTQQ
ncbi:hypothetical protein [Caballeronia sp. dw_276]|uniref:hypothetical protein n=1 Tax=Caballeronia sp. dw_276 TaxID=2719795 RepID=UPI001BD659FB|nr:hypothetical protein [Caballeronia sp. dw_276]